MLDEDLNTYEPINARMSNGVPSDFNVLLFPV